MVVLIITYTIFIQGTTFENWDWTLICSFDHVYKLKTNEYFWVLRFKTWLCFHCQLWKLNTYMWILLRIEIWDAPMQAWHRILRIEIGDWLVLNVIYESDSNVSTFENWDLRLVVLIITYTNFTNINTFENWDLRLAN